MRLLEQKSFLDAGYPRKLREALHLTQQEFASLLNVDVGTIRHWEQGRRKPTSTTNRLLQLFQEKPDLAEMLIGA